MIPRARTNTSITLNNNNDDGRFRFRRRPVVFARIRFLVLVLVAVAGTNRFRCVVAVAYYGTHTHTESSSNINNQRIRNSKDPRFLYHLLRRVSFLGSTTPCERRLDDFCSIRGGGIFEDDNDNDNDNDNNNGKIFRERRRRSLCHRWITDSFPRSRPTITTGSENRWMTKCHGGQWKNNQEHDYHHHQRRSSRRRWLDGLTYNDILRSRLSSPSRFRESYRVVQRGGGNSFVTDDDEYNSNDNEVTVRSSGTYDKINGIRQGNNNKRNNIKGQNNHSPVVYQYFGRSRSRGGGQSYQSSSQAVNFILLGPNVDHWKTVGQTLASRGFNVMACERMVVGDGDGDGNDKDYEAATKYEDAPELVLEILDALKWNKAVLVGCDDESLLAMETAMMLAPERVAGLILCGDLTRANRFAKEAGGVRVLDSFLHRVLDCPFVIVWDGGARSIVSGSSAHEAIETTSSPFDDDDNNGVDGRCVILGGGSAPHRTKPEYFAWVLARFVEEKLEYQTRYAVGGKRRPTMTESSATEENDRTKTRQNRGGILQNLNLPFGIDSVVSPEGRLLLGRAVAAAIFYTSVMKVIVVQYGVIRLGWISVKNSADSVDVLRRKIFQVTGAFFWNFGYVPRLFKFSSKRTKELDEDDIGSINSKIVTVESSEDNESNENSVDSPATSPDGDGTDDPRKEDEDEDNEDPLRIKPLFFLDNIFT